MAGRRVTRRPRAAGPVDGMLHSVYVGIDPSLTGYGLALWSAGGEEAQTFLLTTSASETYAKRLTEIRDLLVRVLGPIKAQVAMICMERPAYDASGAFTGGLTHAATAFGLVDVFGLDDPRVAPVLVAGNTLKKFVTGKGVGKKALMVKWVYKKWGFDTESDDLADAFGLARLASAIASGAWEFEYERQCIETVRKSVGDATRFAPLMTSPTTSGQRTGSTTTAESASARRTRSGARTTASGPTRSARTGARRTGNGTGRTTGSTKRA